MYFLFLPSISYFSFCRASCSKTNSHKTPGLFFAFLIFCLQDYFQFAVWTHSLRSRKKTRRPSRLIYSDYTELQANNTLQVSSALCAQITSQMLSSPPCCHSRLRVMLLQGNVWMEKAEQRVQVHFPCYAAQRATDGAKSTCPKTWPKPHAHSCCKGFKVYMVIS